MKAGLLIRQTHHWAANVFVAAIVLHLLRVFFTGAFRKPRDLTYLLGLTMLVLALLEGYLGLLARRRSAFGDGSRDRLQRRVVDPVRRREPRRASLGRSISGLAVLPAAHVHRARADPPDPIGALLTVHLVLVAARHHTQFRESRRHTEKQVVGAPAFPGQAPRSLALLLAVFAVLFLLGGLVQINPVWLWGPYHVGDATNGAQPDWYLGWLIGALRLVPGFDLTIGHYTVVPGPFWGGALFPLVVFGVLAVWPFAERRLARDDSFHNLLERPRDNPWRTSLGAAFLTWIFLVFMSGSADRVDVFLGLDYTTQIWIYRVLVWVGPALVFYMTRRVCLELVAGERDNECMDIRGD